jgi:hypothetical protein
MREDEMTQDQNTDALAVVANVAERLVPEGERDPELAASLAHARQITGPYMTAIERSAALAAGQAVDGMHRCPHVPGTHRADHRAALDSAPTAENHPDDNPYLTGTEQAQFDEWNAQLAAAKLAAQS